MSVVIVNRALASKVLEIVDAGLVSGIGEPVPGKMCVEAAVCYAMGLPHGDNPSCVSFSLRSLKIKLNDAVWSSDKARGIGLRRLAIAQLGSAGKLNEQEFVRRVVDVTIRVFVPRALRAAADVHPDKAHQDALRSAADRCAAQPSQEAAWAAEAAARAAEAAARAAEAAAWAAEAAAWAAAEAAEAAEEAKAAKAARAAAEAAREAAEAAEAAEAEARDRLLSDFAEAVVQILIELDAPGCAFLDLAPLSKEAV